MGKADIRLSIAAIGFYLALAGSGGIGMTVLCELFLWMLSWYWYRRRSLLVLFSVASGGGLGLLIGAMNHALVIFVVSKEGAMVI